jgi:uncharacterized protein (TIGR02246 family)
MKDEGRPDRVDPFDNQGDPMTALFDQIKASYDSFCTAWTTNDGTALGNFFVEDGSLINPFGGRADGRAAVSAMYTEYFGGMLNGTSTAFKLANARGVENSHAFADGEQTIYAADGTVVLVIHLAALLRRDGDSWRFVDARPYTFATAPA